MVGKQSEGHNHRPTVFLLFRDDCLHFHIFWSNENKERTVGYSPAPSVFLEQYISNTADNISTEEDVMIVILSLL